MSDMVGKPEVEYAGFWLRLVAYIIDSIILMVVQCPLSVFSGILSALTSETQTPEMAVGTVGLQCLIALISLAISVAYHVAFWVWRGQTPGKMAMGIKVVRTDGSPITVGTAFLRYLGYIVSTLILLIGFIMIAFDSRKQGLHDKMAGTYVVRVGQ